jgi:hypothetical protein
MTNSLHIVLFWSNIYLVHLESQDVNIDAIRKQLICLNALQDIYNIQWQVIWHDTIECVPNTRDSFVNPL